MSVEVTITDGPLPAATGTAAPGAGGNLIFEGIVRPTEETRPIAALTYQTYEPMAQRTISAIAAELVSKNGLLGIKVEHSRGRVAVGQCSFRLTINSRHRKEALAAADEFIDRLKADVPIWKATSEE
jgi:molybdopterin synthase catalytic subunit